MPAADFAPSRAGVSPAGPHRRFAFDGLDHRPGSTLTGVGTNLAVGYDALGNITSKTGAGSYDYTTAQTGCSYYGHSQPHAVRNAGGTIFGRCARSTR